MNEKTSKALDWIIQRLKETSTWKGIFSVLTGLGMVIEPNKAIAIMAAGVSIVGVIDIFRQGSPTKSQVADALETKADK